MPSSHLSNILQVPTPFPFTNQPLHNKKKLNHMHNNSASLLKNKKGCFLPEFTSEVAYSNALYLSKSQWHSFPPLSSFFLHQ